EHLLEEVEVALRPVVDVAQGAGDGARVAGEDTLGEILHLIARSLAWTAAASTGPLLLRAVSYAVLAFLGSPSAASASPHATQPGPHVGKSWVAFSPNARADVLRPAARHASDARTSGAGSE